MKDTLRNIVNSSIRQISVGLTGVVFTRFYRFHRSIIAFLLPTPATPIFMDELSPTFVIFYESLSIALVVQVVRFRVEIFHEHSRITFAGVTDQTIVIFERVVQTEFVGQQRTVGNVVHHLFA